MKILQLCTNYHRNKVHFFGFHFVKSHRFKSALTSEDSGKINKDVSKQTQVSFDDPLIAYGNKSTKELLRAYIVFRLCSISFLVDHQFKILTWARKLLGKRLFRSLMSATVYGQFMAGKSAESMLALTEKNRQYNVKSMMYYVSQETHGHTIGWVKAMSEEDLWKENMTEIHSSVDIAAQAVDKYQDYGMIALKITHLTSAEAVKAMAKVITTNTKIVENRTNNKNLRDCLENIRVNSRSDAERRGLPTPHITSDSSVLRHYATNFAFQLSAMKDHDLFMLAKENGYSMGASLTESQVNQLVRLFARISEAAQKAEPLGVRLVVDAEQSYLQLTLDLITLDLMRRHNTIRPVIFNTYQCYRTRTHDIIKRDLDIAISEGFCHGSKVVRGAYLEEERRIAAEQGYPDPINPTYQATTDMYYRVAGELLERVQADKTGKKVQVLFATHNEDTVKYIVDRIQSKNMALDGSSVLFGQLVGMRDHISFSLGHAGIPVCKQVNYGEIDQAITYLSRRVTENRSGIATADKERNMARRALFLRLKSAFKVDGLKSSKH